MKVVITSTGKDFEAAMDTRFGRCAYFAIYDSNTKKYTFVENTAGQSEQGAGIAAAQDVLKIGADALLTGRLGPKAKQVIESSPLKTVFYESGTIAEVVYEFMKTQP